jgi:hypothetical protein
VQQSSGVVFPMGGDGKRSTLAAGRSIFADSVRNAAPDLAERIEHTKDWHRNYLRPVRDIIAVAATAPEAAVSISQTGLESAHRRLRFQRDGIEVTLSEALAQYREPAFASVTVHGTSNRETDFSVPYQGRRLFGDHLRRQVDTWITAGIAEPSFAAAINAVLDNPDWLDLADVNVAVLGAGAEMAPTRHLLRWGAHVHAIDLPKPDVWAGLIDVVRRTAGTMRLPIRLSAEGAPPFVVDGRVHPDDDARIAQYAGANLIVDMPEVRTWIDEIDAPFVLGNYAYADGAQHALLSVAADAIASDLLGRRNDIALAFLATPTDAFMVPAAAVAESRRRWRARGIGGVLQAPLRMLHQFEPNYPPDTPSSYGINDSLVPQQGPNYVLAKRLQRWRAVTARQAGVRVSLNIAPATRTQSVIKNRALAAAYAGASRFGVEVFEPGTSRALMAALLVHDLRNPEAVSQPSVPLSNPMDLFASAANHGGLWRTAYEPRSVLGIAAVLGMFNSRA